MITETTLFNFTLTDYLPTQAECLIATALGKAMEKCSRISLPSFAGGIAINKKKTKEAINSTIN